MLQGATSHTRLTTQALGCIRLEYCTGRALSLCVDVAERPRQDAFITGRRAVPLHHQHWRHNHQPARALWSPTRYTLGAMRAWPACSLRSVCLLGGADVLQPTPQALRFLPLSSLRRPGAVRHAPPQDCSSDVDPIALLAHRPCRVAADSDHHDDTTIDPGGSFARHSNPPAALSPHPLPPLPPVKAAGLGIHARVLRVYRGCSVRQAVGGDARAGHEATTHTRNVRRRSRGQTGPGSPCCLDGVCIARRHAPACHIVSDAARRCQVGDKLCTAGLALQSRRRAQRRSFCRRDHRPPHRPARMSRHDRRSSW